MCHFYICSDVHDSYKGDSNRLKSWADYLFPNLEIAPKEARFGVVEKNILRMMREHNHGDIILEEDDDIYEKGNSFKSFRHHAHQPISKKALLAGFLSVWLKRCVVSSPSSVVVLLTALLSAVHLIHCPFLGLLSAIVCCIQRDLRALMKAFCRPATKKRGKGTVLPRDGPNLRIGLPYAYLMA